MSFNFAVGDADRPGYKLSLRHVHEAPQLLDQFFPHDCVAGIDATRCQQLGLEAQSIIALEFSAQVGVRNSLHQFAHFRFQKLVCDDHCLESGAVLTNAINGLTFGLVSKNLLAIIDDVVNANAPAPAEA